MTDSTDDLADQILQCANRAAGTSLMLPPGGDILLEAFAFDSLSLFSFLLELERACGVKFDDALLAHEQLSSIRATVAFIRDGKLVP